ncbi:nucleotide sugar dehydrogenase [Sciscionella sediminilitoris]|uniref:nucleotide sugar dehydrogenase n=1 Tax=Sciscionella sediminilitoris TaxID=1445613 RepID=UPI0004DFC8B8|nr:nucleotide sugar dehydrogenase [Sciscionella sp. SE31]
MTTLDAAPRPVLTGTHTVAVLGMGYVGLPTALALWRENTRILGIDASPERLAVIAEGAADLLPADRLLLRNARHDPRFVLTTDPDRMAEADTVLICVPTPVDACRTPDLGPLRAVCADVVRSARPGQTLVLTSTTYLGCTRELLADPLRDRGLRAGTEVFIAFSPERIDPGRAEHTQVETPRVVGGITPECTRRAAELLALFSPDPHIVDSPEIAELTKLYENSFRAVNIALANELAGICGTFGIDPIAVTEAAATKPYGYMPFYPGPGVGGHCIPCDPHYLLWQLRAARHPTPLLNSAMEAIAARPGQVVARALTVLSDAGHAAAGARVLVVGVSYKPGVADIRDSPARQIIGGLVERGARVSYHDPLVDSFPSADGVLLRGVSLPQQQNWDLVLVHTLHEGIDYDWLADCPLVLDASYRLPRTTGLLV